MTTLLYQGHGSYRITADDGTCIYVDPFAGGGYDVPADLILVTHEHFDHTATDLMPHAPGCECIRAADIHPEPGTYLELESHGIALAAVQAENGNHPVDECVGFIVRLDGLSVYASGDTSTTDDMRSGTLAAMQLDYALLPGDGVYNMDIEEASEAAALVNARHTIPVHLMPVHGPNSATDPACLFSAEKAERFRAPGKLVLHPGESIEL